jgi:pyruvate kinase
MRRTKIICTIGPASENVTTLTSMMKAGMDVARLNFSHGTHAGHRKLFRAVHTAAKVAGKHVPIIGDLQGPKIRVGHLPKEGVVLKKGNIVVFSTAQDAYKNDILPVTYKNLHKDVKKGDRLLIDDGLVEAVVESVKGQKIQTKILNEGIVTSHKGMNFPDSNLCVSAMTEKDKEDAMFATKLGVDWVALSFVTDPKDVLALKRLLKKHTPKDQHPPRVIVKIEKHEAVDRFREILEVADAVMIARGDLGVEIDAEDVPIYQKEMTEIARLAGKPVVVATQMLDSMIRNPRPTRAEVSDVANAVFDHADGVMLSGESATGKYPLQSVKMMKNIIEAAEESPYDDVLIDTTKPSDQLDTLAHTIKLMANKEAIDAVVISYELAPWAEVSLKMHPEIPLYIATRDAREARRVALRWGVTAFVMKSQKESTFVKQSIKKLRDARCIKKGMHLGMVLGGIHGEGIDLVTVE